MGRCRQSARRHRASPLRYEKATEEKLRQVYADPTDWDWAKASAKLIACASPPVLEATRTVEAANDNVQAKLNNLEALRRMADSPLAGRPAPGEVPAKWREAEAANAAAKDANDVLEALIRADLARKPSESALTDGVDTRLSHGSPPGGYGIRSRRPAISRTRGGEMVCGRIGPLMRLPGRVAVPPRPGPDLTEPGSRL